MLRLIAVLVTLIAFAGSSEVSHMSRENIWITIANRTNQEAICLSLGGALNPFRTCLVGLPVWNPGKFKGYVGNDSLKNDKVKSECPTQGATGGQKDSYWQCQIILSLNKTLASPPKELNLFGST